MKAKPRTVRQVEAAQSSVLGCCDLNVNQGDCGCLDRAKEYERERKNKLRTVAEVKAAQRHPACCCDRYAEMKPCDCLEQAQRREDRMKAKNMGLPSPSEKVIQSQIMQYLTARRIFHWRQNQGATVVPAVGGAKRRFFRMTSVDGVSDILGILPDGRFLSIEVKAGRNGPTEAQAEFLRLVNAAGGLGFVARSVEDVERELDAASKGDG